MRPERDGDSNVSEPTPIDLAGMERFTDDPGTPDSGVGPAPVVDRGAFEFVPIERILGGCYANCDGSVGTPPLNVNAFICFQSRFAASDPYADCDQSSTLNFNDLICFQSDFAAGCP